MANVGKKGKLHDLQDVSNMTWPDLQEGSQRVGGGDFGSGQQAQENIHSADERIPDAVGNPLPQLLGAVPLQNQELPELVSNSSGSDEDQYVLEDGPEWYPDDATPTNPFGFVEDDTDAEPTDRSSFPRRSSTQNRGAPPNRFAAAFVANLEREVKTPTSVREALECPERVHWEVAMAAEMGSLRENQVYRLVPRPKGKKLSSQSGSNIMQIELLRSMRAKFCKGFQSS